MSDGLSLFVTSNVKVVVDASLKSSLKIPACTETGSTTAIIRSSNSVTYVGRTEGCDMWYCPIRLAGFESVGLFEG